MGAAPLGREWRTKIGLALLGVSLGAAAPSPDVHQPPGKLYDTADARLHLYCLGQGSPTIVLEAGLGGNHMDWTFVQPRLAEHNRVCSYDRAGAGFSDKASRPRTLENLDKDLESLLASAGVDGPLVLVGHSFGGVLAATFAARHRDRVVGLVLVDSMHPREFESFAAAGAPLPSNPYQVLNRTPAAAAAYGLPDGMQRLAIELASADKARLSVIREMRGIGASLTEADRSGYVRIPARVLVHGDDEWNELYPDGRMERVWRGLQADLARRLGAPAPEIVPHAGHQIPLDAPGAVVKAVNEVLQDTRR
ncbi:alpha/beta fold hydrolase [Alsobacter soli]|nr:alpha/beta hydrolase [Alsobacter soli]